MARPLPSVPRASGHGREREMINETTYDAYEHALLTVPEVEPGHVLLTRNGAALVTQVVTDARMPAVIVSLMDSDGGSFGAVVGPENWSRPIRRLVPPLDVVDR